MSYKLTHVYCPPGVNYDMSTEKVEELPCDRYIYGSVTLPPIYGTYSCLADDLPDSSAWAFAY